MLTDIPSGFARIQTLDMTPTSADIYYIPECTSASSTCVSNQSVFEQVKNLFLNAETRKSLCNTRLFTFTAASM